MTAPNPKVDAFLDRAKKWQPEMRALRRILLATGLEEEVKWGKPCYTLDGHNVALIGPFKEYVAVLFMKGALLKDPQGLLDRAGEVQAGRLVKFTSAAQLAEREAALKLLLRDAIAAEKNGLEVEVKREVKMPAELAARLKKDAKLRAAFSALTPGRQRAYGFYFSGAKQAKTREARIDKHAARILAGKGLDD